MIVAGIEFPDNCPENCPEKKRPFFQGNVCSRCPIFSCKEGPSPYDGTKWRLVEPDEYREDWAIEFKKWFDNDMTGIPKLYLMKGAKS